MAARANSNDAQGAAAFEAEATSQGFAIRLPTAQLADLIQINCLNRVRGAFRVCSGVDEGHLFFADGQLVHAELDGVVGLDAVVMMLGLRGGSIEPCEQPWPALATIDMGADALLLSAAQRLDEGGERRSDPGRDLTTKVVRRAHLDGSQLDPAQFELAQFDPERFDVAQLDDGYMEPAELAPAELEPIEEPIPGNDVSSVPSVSAPASSGLQNLALAQVALDGTIQRLRCGACPELADTAFYSQQVAALIGDALNLGQCQAIAFEGTQESIIIFRGRNITAVRGANADLLFVRAKVGLP